MLCLFQQSVDQHSSRASSLRFRGNRDGADLGQVHSVEMQGAAAHDLAFVLDHDEVADVLADLAQRARQQRAIAHVDLDQLLDGKGVGKFGATRTHGRLLNTWIVFPSPSVQGLPHARRSRTSFDVVDGQHIGECQRVIELLDRPRCRRAQNLPAIVAQVRNLAPDSSAPPCRSVRVRGEMALPCARDAQPPPWRS